MKLLRLRCLYTKKHSRPSRSSCVLFLISTLVQNKIKKYCRYTSYRNAACADKLDSCGKFRIKCRSAYRNQCHRNADCNDHHVTVAYKIHLGQCLYSAGRNHSEHCKACAAKHHVRYAGNNCRELRQKTKYHEYHAAHGYNIAASNACNAYKTYVLRKSSIRKRIKHTAKSRRESVRTKCFSENFLVSRLVYYFSDSNYITCCFSHSNKHDESHCYTGYRLKYRHSESEWCCNSQ